jgi:hypothetical protein
MSTRLTGFLDIKSLLTPPNWLSQLGNVKKIQTFLGELGDALRKDQRTIRVMRFAVGVTLAVVFAFTIQWPLAFLTPVLTAVILALPLPVPSISAGLTNMLYTFIAFLIGVVFTLFLLPFPLVYIPMLGLALFNIYYFINRGGSFWFGLMSLLAVLILPLLGNNHEGLAFGFAFGFIWSGWLTVVMIWLAHFLFPDPDGQSLPAGTKFQAGYSAVAAELALKSTMVALPIVILFITYNWVGQLLVMVFAAIFTLSPDLTKGSAAAKNSITSTLIGGVAALAFYWLIVAVPEFHFFILLMLFTTLMFAQQIFSDKPSAGYFGSAFVALFILMNSSMDAEGSITSAFVLRIIFILLAAIYVVAALNVLERFWPDSAKQSNSLETVS